MSVDSYQLEHRYTREQGRVFLTGTQALVRIALMQRQLDRQAGRNTAGFVSGYRGSPLGALDMELWRAGDLLAAHDIEFMPAVNEDLAATAVLGTQQVETDPHRNVDGVFAIWYGKGPGVDRSGDALKHGNAYGSSPNGGVLVVAGDDHGAVSSSMPHQSDVAFLTFLMPHLNPASVAEYLYYGLYGFALSRFSGCWVGFKAISETVESARSIDVGPLPSFQIPNDFDPPVDGLHYRWPDLPGPQIEERLEAKKQAALAFARANPIDRRIFDVPAARYGIVTTGKAHLDLMEALRLLGIDAREARRIGLDVYKVGMVWPLENRQALDFVRGKQEVLVVEEKRGIIESWFKEAFYDYPGHKPERMVGKKDEYGERLIPWVGELSPLELAPIVARRLDAAMPGLELTSRAHALARRGRHVVDVSGAVRRPYFCSGCPHNTSTKVPEGSEALAGIGCHFMASWMDRDTSSLIQMGGEGVNWIAKSRYNGGRHVFQNLGEGTYYHSGSMAIRQAVAAGTNITFKILFNDAVAMTGGQPVDGPITVARIAQSMRAEGIERIAVVADDPGRHAATDFPARTTFHDRRDMDAVQRELREISGVTILIYDQACTTELRRRRKRGLAEDPDTHVVINELVCEGCGDCSVESNCLSVVPKETVFGRKRQIDADSCNKDYSCVNGFCPSFVTVRGASLRRREAANPAPELKRRLDALPAPRSPELAPGDVHDILVTGVGGTGVVTVGQLITMAAHLEGKGSSVLDFMGFAQKFGPVRSYVRLAGSPDELNQVRIDPGGADALIGCDLVVSSSPDASLTYDPSRTHAVVNSAEMPTADFVLHRDATLRAADRLDAIRGACASLVVVDAAEIARKILGDTIYANVVMLGSALQAGLVPVSLEAIERAILLNGVKPDENRVALAIGRLAAEEPGFVELHLADKVGSGVNDEMPLDALITHRRRFLVEYQGEGLARRFEQLVGRARSAEDRAAGVHSDTEAGEADYAFTAAIARSWFKLLAYKDEYEVARLHTDPGFAKRLAERFDGEYRVQYHLAPPLISRGRDARGRPLKRTFGPWMRRAFGVLARLKRLRGTPFDPFGYTEDRRLERALIAEFESFADRLISGLSAENLARSTELAALAMDVRGYGPVKAAAAEVFRGQMREAVNSR